MTWRTTLCLCTALLLTPATWANQPEDNGQSSASPIPAMNETDLAAGRQLFSVHCARCHGMQGDGGEGPSLQRARLKHVSDDESLFEVINDGIQGTGMPGTWAPNDDEIW